MVSVIIPAYNAGRYVFECLLSISRQSYEHIEILLINDGSNDDTLEVCYAYQANEPRLRVLNRKNSGVSSTRNAGILEAKGEWLCFIDADDYIEPTFIENLLRNATDTNLSVANIVHNNGLDTVFPSNWSQLELNPNSTAFDYFIGGLGARIGFSCCNKLFAKKLIIDNNLRFNEKIKIGEDMLFVYQYIELMKTVSLSSEGLYHYRIYNTSSMNSQTRDYLPEYDLTLSEIETNKTIPYSVLGAFSIRVLQLVVMSPLVVNLKWSRFKEYYRHIKSSKAFEIAHFYAKPTGIKQRMLLSCLHLKNPLPLFYLVRLNRLCLSLS